jgi:hypothetical protein
MSLGSVGDGIMLLEVGSTYAPNLYLADLANEDLAGRS